MSITDMEARLDNLDQRLARIERILPTLFTKADFDRILPTLATKADLERLALSSRAGSGLAG